MTRGTGWMLEGDGRAKKSRSAHGREVRKLPNERDRLALVTYNDTRRGFLQIETKSSETIA
jgi:hypothetical protein